LSPVETPDAEVQPPLSTSVKSMGLKVGDVAQLLCRIQYGAPNKQSGYTNAADNGPQDPQFKMFLGNQDLTPKATVQSNCTQNTPLCYKTLVRFLFVFWIYFLEEKIELFVF